MKSSHISREQIIAILEDRDAGVSLEELCRKYGSIRRAEVPKAKRVKILEDENIRLKRLLVDAMLDNAKLRGLLGR
jgi:putative transposase